MMRMTQAHLRKMTRARELRGEWWTRLVLGGDGMLDGRLENKNYRR